jgi:hypothetical protein
VPVRNLVDTRKETARTLKIIEDGNALDDETSDERRHHENVV